MKERYKQFQKANKLSYGLTYPTKGRIYDKRRSARAYRKALYMEGYKVNYPFRKK